jgi:hypothetical protein
LKVTLNITDTLNAIAAIDIEAAQIVAALDVHMANEPDHGKRGALHRLRSALTDFHFNMQQARVQFQASARHSAMHGLNEVGDQLREVLADAAANDPNRGPISDVINKIAKVKTAIAR